MEAFVTFIYCLTDSTTAWACACACTLVCVCCGVREHVWMRNDCRCLNCNEVCLGVLPPHFFGLLRAQLCLYRWLAESGFNSASQLWQLLSMLGLEAYRLEPAGVDTKVQTETPVVWNPSTLTLLNYSLVCVIVCDSSGHSPSRTCLSETDRWKNV